MGQAHARLWQGDAGLTDPVPIRDAATVILVRDTAAGPAVLMGQRGRSAAFLPGKFVFPGGAVDDADADIALTLAPDQTTALAAESNRPPVALVAAAIRELWEEAGQIIGASGHWSDAPPDWRSFAATGHVPVADPLRFFFRAVTPTGRPRRFDARFFVAQARALVTDPDDFTAADDELSHLQWVTLAQAQQFDLPFITQVVLAELRAHLADLDRPHIPPFFRNDDETHLVTRLAGQSPL